ncbi:hypothetical protein [uncultured Campylobacter sp.]|uniref:hypothetical protein n=1 Tax=uncultured Campylobacter sp. TaxID=218934 RepID=UPI00260D99E8|nr:hypothetical protein [uncultured Campylobacter sp.]
MAIFCLIVFSVMFIFVNPIYKATMVRMEEDFLRGLPSRDITLKVNGYATIFRFISKWAIVISLIFIIADMFK